ncbi:MAG: KH domain-containing protein [bacterium]|nr:KH domain-containing protein [bacterium]
MRTLEQQGKTVDDAITKALEELNVSRDQISVEILDEGSRGLFGLMGTRPAKIRVNVTQDASYDAIKKELQAVQQTDKQESKPREKRAKDSGRRSQGTSRNRGRSQSRPNERQKERAKEVPKERVKETPREQVKETPREQVKETPKEQVKETPRERVKETPRERVKETPREQVKESSKEQVKESPKEYDEKDIQQITEKAKDSLSVILSNLQIEYTVEAKRRDDQILLNIKCDNENFLIGRRGTTLDAVQYLVNRIANKNIEEKIQVVLDTSDYRTNRKQRLEKLALRLSRRVKTTGKSVTVAPMNPHDRRIIHLTLQDDSTIRTLSRGTGFMRRIIISANRSSKHRKPQQ